MRIMVNQSRADLSLWVRNSCFWSSDFSAPTNYFFNVCLWAPGGVKMVSRADGIMKTMESKIEISVTHAMQLWPEKIYRKGWIVGRLEERSFWVNSPPISVKYGWQWLLMLGFPTLWIESIEPTHCTHAVPPLWPHCYDMVGHHWWAPASIHCKSQLNVDHQSTSMWQSEQLCICRIIL